MPEPLTTYVGRLLDELDVALGKGLTAKNYLDVAGDFLVAGDSVSAGTALINSATWLGDFVSHLCRYKSWLYNVTYYEKACWEWVDVNWPTATTLTMDDILNEMLSASFEQLTKFMGITQAYKVAVWDAPFNEEFYAALARGFKTWGE